MVKAKSTVLNGHCSPVSHCTLGQADPAVPFAHTSAVMTRNCYPVSDHMIGQNLVGHRDCVIAVGTSGPVHLSLVWRLRLSTMWERRHIKLDVMDQRPDSVKETCKFNVAFPYPGHLKLLRTQTRKSQRFKLNITTKARIIGQMEELCSHCCLVQITKCTSLVLGKALFAVS